MPPTLTPIHNILLFVSMKPSKPKVQQTTWKAASHNYWLCWYALGVDVEVVRTFVAAADAGQFQEAAVDLHVTQQAVSKRIAALERELGVSLFNRAARGSELTVDGQAFLPHARELLRTAVRAVESVQPGTRALRVDVVHRRIAPAVALQEFYRSNKEVPLDVVTLGSHTAEGAVAAVRDGLIDATFRAYDMSKRLPLGVEIGPTLNSALELLVGPAHPLANFKEVDLSQLGGHRIWVPGIIDGSEWAVFYAQLAKVFGLSIDALGPHFGDEALMDQLSTSSNLATLVGDHDRYLWPTQHDLRRIRIRNPTPVYPHSLIWLNTNPHPGLTALRAYLESYTAQEVATDMWTAEWLKN